MKKFYNSADLCTTIMRRLADNMSVMLKMYATGKAEQPEIEPWNPMHFIR